MRLSSLSLAALAGLAALPAAAKDASYIGTVETVAGDSAGMARGTVFVDANRNSRLDAGETGIEGALVTNGREVVATGADGTYALPAYDDMNLSVIKPAGYANPVDQQMIPQFAYVHKQAGSPELRFGGIAPTGPLPAAINFPMIEDAAGDRFSCLAFGDAQPYTNQEVSYVRETAGKLLATADLSSTECLIFAGDVMGDDLSLYPRFKRIIAVGQTPQYWVGGNHDVDFDAETDAHSFDTFRREWGPEYWAAEFGDVLFIGLDNVRYPCNGVDPHPFCSTDKSHTYNGVISERQMEWLGNLLPQVPEDRLIVMTAHIPFQTFTDNTAAKHQTDNLAELAALLDGRKVLTMAGHTHTTENIEPGEGFEGWEAATGLATSPFHQLVIGGLSGSWWAGDLNAQGVPHATQRLGSPRGYFRLDFDGATFVDTYLTFHTTEDSQFHAAFNTPRFRKWADTLITYAELYGTPSKVLPPVTRNDLADPFMLTRADLEGDSWVAVNVWNGGKSTEVTVSIDGGTPMAATRTQPGEGEAKYRGLDYADPAAILKQATQGSLAIRSDRGGDDTAGYAMFQGNRMSGVAGPFPRWLLTDNSLHLWRADLPSDLSDGVHVMTVTATDRHGRAFTTDYTFEVVAEIPQMTWQTQLWQ
ncbi:calcineurin-like phosphoesterase C-terminal domain-containing protein [Marinovum algicola]|uniref:calcineurin-like phosphoesterase C-terminal domain-containing protein n=1 Tax=Marinovum algicola TaxID=42444 RepID=UPI0024BAA9B3|nr:calcineurin-like phosphoesterase C-terminal domain-containing protein [Marinovum algicola]